MSEGQKNVVLAVVGNSTVSLTAASTLVTSLITFLVVALKYQQRWIWILWALDLVLSCILWFYIRRRRRPYQLVFGRKASTFILILSCSLDTFGLIPTIIAASNKATGNCVTMMLVEKVEILADRGEAFVPFQAGPLLSSHLALSPCVMQTGTSSIVSQCGHPVQFLVIQDGLVLASAVSSGMLHSSSRTRTIVQCRQRATDQSPNQFLLEANLASFRATSTRRMNSGSPE